MRLSRALLAVPVAALVFVFPGVAHADESVQVQLQDLNETGATGTATLTATSGGDLKVMIRSKGMTPNSVPPVGRGGSAEEARPSILANEAALLCKVSTQIRIVSIGVESWRR